MMLMAERHGLDARHIDISRIGRAIYGIDQSPEGEKAEKSRCQRYARKAVAAFPKNLAHHPVPRKTAGFKNRTPDPACVSSHATVGGKLGRMPHSRHSLPSRTSAWRGAERTTPIVPVLRADATNSHDRSRALRTAGVAAVTNTLLRRCAWTQPVNSAGGVCSLFLDAEKCSI